PASGQEYFDRLRHACAFHETAELNECPVAGDGEVATVADATLSAARLVHAVDTFGYRLVEPDGRRMLPELLARYGIAGPAGGRLEREGALDVGRPHVAVEQVSG